MSGSDVVVRYWAAAKAAAGTSEERFAPVTDLADLLEAIRGRHDSDARLAEVLQRCSYLIDEVSPGRRPPSEVLVPPGATVDVLPPFAGGSRDRDGAGTPQPARGLAPA